MKKSLFFYAAAAALMLTACSSEDDILQTGQTKKVAPQEVGFDVYTPAATNATRAGLVGTMTTNRLQRSAEDQGGFGVYAFLTEDTDDDGGTSESAAAATAYTRGSKAPNFMYNEMILWNNTNLGWYYNPLKYWPNETDNDSQATPAYMQTSTANQHLDRLTFFAYAPYVSTGSGATGITAISDNTGKLNSTDVTDPTVKWVATTSNSTFNPNEGVDLLWGVAPSGGLSYTAVNGWTVTRNEYTPLLNMIKPDVNTSMKFLFQHALARFGVNVVAAIDQVSPGGELDPNTKITINSFTISGPFGTQGELNLNNDGKPGVANWTEIQNTSITSDKKAISSIQNITVTANDATPANNAIAKNLRFAGTHVSPIAQDVVGVTPAKQDLLIPSNKWFNKLSSAPAYNPGKEYYTNETGTTPAVATVANGTKVQIDGKWGYFYTLSSGKYVKQNADVDAPTYPTYTYGTASTLYFVAIKNKYTIDKDNAATFPPASVKLYEIDHIAHNGSTEDKAPVFTYSKTSPVDPSTQFAQNSENGKVYYTLDAVNLSTSELPYKYDAGGTYYEAERNYLYVVPTNNVATNAGLTADQEKALRTITVQIEYYITTKDEKLDGGYAQTKNVITKEVLLPSLANGKTYMLNLVLGLTSVKVEAEVDDWKVVNVQADLPQNTAE